MKILETSLYLYSLDYVCVIVTHILFAIYFMKILSSLFDITPNTDLSPNVEKHYNIWCPHIYLKINSLQTHMENNLKLAFKLF